MQCKRDGLVPIGEVVVGLGGAVKAIRQISPQALHHFICFDQSASIRWTSLSGPAKRTPTRVSWLG